MKTYLVSIELQVEVQAFNKEDAFQAVEDVFGPGDANGLDVLEFEVLESVERT